MENNFESEKSELSAEEEGIVKAFEKLPYFQHHRDGNEIDLLLVWCGLKPATELDFGEVWSPGEEEKVLSEDKLQESLAILRQAGLVVTGLTRERKEARHVTEDERMPDKVPYDEPGYDKVRVYVSKNSSLADKLFEAQKKLNDGDLEAETTYGQLSGFPESAIAAYSKALHSTEPDSFEKNTMLRDELPEDIRSQEFAAFATFRLSRDHWQEEIGTAKLWAEEIQRLNPKLHARIVKTYLEE